MADAPNSYKDPYWSNLAGATETKLGLPAGLLTSIVLSGERTNNDKVSDAGAKTVFQITPSTRKAAIDKYGIDPYLSPENAAEVSGRLLKDSLDRNNGSIPDAVGEYIGGTDRSNWGPTTKSYIARVTNNVPDQGTAPDSFTAALNGATGSTYDKALASMPQPGLDPNSVANIYSAYKSGKMTPEQSADFEADVKAGKIMLPRDATLNGQAPANGPVMLPQSVTAAYRGGQMTPQQRKDLEDDMRAGRVKLPPLNTDLVPDENNPNWTAPTEQGIINQTPAAPSPTLGQRLVGAGETGLAMATGAPASLAGQVVGIGNLAKSVLNGTFGTPQAADLAARSAEEFTQAHTYSPRTAAGQEYTENVGNALAQTIPIAPMGAEMAALSEGAAAARPAVAAAADVAAGRAAQATRAATQPVTQAAGRAAGAVANVPARTLELLGLKEPEVAAAPSYGTAPSAGSAGTDMATLRRTKAEGLPVPIDLTLGAETRDAGQLAFEKEQMKNAELGGPLRERANENNLQALGNFDALVDETGAQAPDIAATGNKVVDALSKGYQAAKNEVNVKYTKARNSEESNAAVDPSTPVAIGEGDNAINDSLVGYLNGKVQGVPSSAVTDAARKILVKMGIAAEDDSGNLVAQPTTVGQMEAFRKEISGTAKWDDKTGLRDETIIKKLTDATTAPVAGPLWQDARATRAAMARKFENRAIVARLVNNRPGFDDPQVAADQVFQRSIVNSSPEEITFLKRVLNTSGEDGQQAWRELQGSLVNHIKSEATKNMGMDAGDRPMVSPAKLNQVVQQLDKNGRLDIVLGKKNAATVRDLNDVVRYVNTVPPGTLINTSGTVGALMAAVSEAATTGVVTGLPVPVLSTLRMLRNHINDVKIKAKIDKALNKSTKGHRHDHGL